MNKIFCRSIYHHKDYSNNWKRITLPMLDQTVYGTAVRFKWSQIYTASNIVGDWAIDNIVIGNRSLHCPQLCRGHGRCTLNSTCICNEGFSGTNCAEVDAAFPSYIQVKIIIFYKKYVLLHAVLLQVLYIKYSLRDGLSGKFSTRQSQVWYFP